MKRRAHRPAPPAPELPLDVAEAAGSFGLFSGLLSAFLPYFLGLVVALSILGAGVGIVRISTLDPSGSSNSRTAVAAFAPVAVGWAIFLAARDLWRGTGGSCSGSPRCRSG